MAWNIDLLPTLIHSRAIVYRGGGFARDFSAAPSLSISHFHVQYRVEISLQYTTPLDRS